MIHEYLPPRVDYQTEHTRPEFQGALNSCTRFGLTSALEMMAARAGDPQQLSVMFLWYFTDKRKLSVESAIDTLNAIGTCRDELCPYVARTEPPYDVIDLGMPPSMEAMQDSDRIQYKVRAERIAGREECMRALAQGHALVTCRVYPGGAEHVEAAIGYDVEEGLKIHGSGWAIYYESWDNVENGTITQIWKLCDTPWAPVPHPEYVEGDLPSLENGVLTLPKVRVYVGWPQASLHFKNVSFQMLDCNPVADDSRVDRELVWHSPQETLYVPKMLIDGVLTHKVSITKPVATLIHAEEA